mmetsp:Transcript_10932/g.37181  ORF Transcript_10932/g.37181 Transcript_10932/m.37181 type:complete len:201 (+) Transcript_10932:574-1176(+)
MGGRLCGAQARGDPRSGPVPQRVHGEARAGQAAAHCGLRGRGLRRLRRALQGVWRERGRGALPAGLPEPPLHGRQGGRGGRGEGGAVGEARLLRGPVLQGHCWREQLLTAKRTVEARPSRARRSAAVRPTRSPLSAQAKGATSRVACAHLLQTSARRSPGGQDANLGDRIMGRPSATGPVATRPCTSRQSVGALLQKSVA